MKTEMHLRDIAVKSGFDLTLNGRVYSITFKGQLLFKSSRPECIEAYLLGATYRR